jgi:hypothetical protein
VHCSVFVFRILTPRKSEMTPSTVKSRPADFISSAIALSSSSSGNASIQAVHLCGVPTLDYRHDEYQPNSRPRCHRGICFPIVESLDLF